MSALMEIIDLADGRTLAVHPPSECLSGVACCIHSPSDHPLSAAPLNWRGDRAIMERICPHGIGHPDPDDLAFRRLLGDDDPGTHGCDGCCRAEVVDGEVLDVSYDREELTPAHERLALLEPAKHDAGCECCCRCALDEEDD